MAERLQSPPKVGHKLASHNYIVANIFSKNKRIQHGAMLISFYPYHHQSRRTISETSSSSSSICSLSATDMVSSSLRSSQTTRILSHNSNPVFVAAPIDKKGPYAFAVDFLMGGVSAAV